MSEARYLQASSVFGSAIELGLTEDISSDGMSLVGGQAIQIESSGVYRFTYSISFRPMGGEAVSGNLHAELGRVFPLPSVVIPGSESQGGAFIQSGFAGLEWGTVANSVITRLADASVYQVALVVQSEEIVVSLGWRSFTAERIAL